MSNYQDPNYNQQPVVRHRRSERHRQETEKTAQAPAVNSSRQLPPEQEPADEIKWQRRVPSNWPEENDSFASSPMPRGRKRQPSVYSDDQMYMRRSVPLDDDCDDDGDTRSFPWMKLIVGLLIVVLLGCVALHFIQDAGPLNPIKNAIDGLVQAKVKEPGKAISFQAASNSGSINTRLLLSLTTNQAVDGVRIEDVDGNDIACTVTLVNSANETNKTWNINAIFDAPYSGDVYAVIRQDNNWTRTDQTVSLVITGPTPVPAETPPPTQMPLTTVVPPVFSTEEPVTDNIPLLVESDDNSIAPVITWAPTAEPVLTEAPTEEPIALPTEEPTPDPTAVPTQIPFQGPTGAPTSTPLPRLEAFDGVGSPKSSDTVFQNKKSVTFTRKSGYIAPNPDSYTHYPLGVPTFRGDNFRRNAAFGIVNIENESMTVLWESPIGSLRTEDNGTLYGVGWTGQPAIIRWTQEVRPGLNLYEEKKNQKYFTEVIFGAQDGKIYFLDLLDGSPSRDPINVGYPLKGSVSVDCMDRPLLAVGQGISKLANGKTGSIGLRLFNLVTGKEVYMINGRKHDGQEQYSTNGAFDGTALFLCDQRDVNAMVVAGENGLLYTVDLNMKFEYPNSDFPDRAVSIDIKPEITYLRTKSAGEKDNLTAVESSVAMYDKYIYMADAYGIIRCVDSDTMTTVWAVDGGDNIDAAIALDMDENNSVSLYTGNTCYSRLGTKNPVTIRRLNALTGEEIWHYDIKCDYDKNQLSGCKASPVIGQNAIGNLVIFTVNKVEGGGSKILALNKQSGQAVWEKALPDEAISSPVAVYDERGEAWIIQGDEGGNLTMLYARTGEVRSSINLGGAIQGSPAVYKNYLVVGTCSKNNANMYCVKLN
ncbi:MAG: PQQ-binding-like beta-propeller repeat protein [Clostridia bacterium]|nr:PQQ-binding-like beta-propeller repeat protein [Clostridia bacterium]